MNIKRNSNKIRKRVLRMMKYLFGVKTFQEAYNMMIDCKKAIERKTGKSIEEVDNLEDMKKIGEHYCLYSTLKKLVDMYLDVQIFGFNFKKLEEDYGY